MAGLGRTNKRTDWKLYDLYRPPVCIVMIRASCYNMAGFPPQSLILVVDDDVFERLGAADMFSHAGYDVLEAGNADEALRCFEANSEIKLLFTDFNMPGLLNGSDLVHQVAKRWPSVGIMMTSGRPQPRDLPLHTSFHAKPYNPADVLPVSYTH